MNTIETIFTVILFSMSLGLFILSVSKKIDRSQVERHKKIKQDHLKSLRDESTGHI
jgi:hypothetical protein